MTTTTITASAPVRTSVRPASVPGGLLGQCLRQIRFELKDYVRHADTLVFTFGFPIIMLAIFTSAFASQGTIPNPDGVGLGLTVGAYYLPGMIAAGVLLSGVQNLAVDIAHEKSDGRLKRWGGTPMSPFVYFAGKIGQVVVTATAQTALLLVVAHSVLGISLPATAHAWRTFAWVWLLGLTASSLLGIALSALPRSGRSASSVVLPITLVLQFISGVYLQFYALPTWMQNLASAFPLKWLAQGMRAAFLPDGFRQLEVGQSWNLGQVAIALGVWLVLGVVLSRLTFRWIRRDA
jgi:ABC-2 type transport system permease protein